LLLAASLPVCCGCATLLSRGSKEDASNTLPVSRGQEDDDGIEIGSGMTQAWMNRLTGRGAASEVPVAKKLPWFGAPNADEQVARAHFEEAQRAFQEGKFAVARTSFETAASHLPNSPLQEDALFMIGETYFAEEKYPKAFTAYEELLEKYRRSRHLDAAVNRQFAIGDYWHRVHMKKPSFILKPNFTDGRRPLNDTLGRALRAFTKVRLHHPTGPLADDSLMATANSYFVRGRYDDADYYYNLLRREHPSSEHQYEAHVLGIQSKIRRYQGPEYDGIPLEEARDLIDQTARQFPNMSNEDRQRLARMRWQVMTGLAQREFTLAKYYERKGYYGAARTYHERILEDYAQTPFADKAKERLADIEDEPAVPAPRFTWISSLFPETEEDPLKFETANAAGDPDTWQR
jgi:outer membrane assembly lipoprotein YfiO